MLVVPLFIGFPSAVDAAGSSPFSSLSGSWLGTGTIAVSNGPSERIRCRATYTVAEDGLQLRQELRCASDSYNFQVSGRFTYRGGQIAGTWTEKTRNATGQVSGTATGNEIRATVQGGGFSASVLMVTRGNRQTVSMSTSRSDITTVSAELRRS